MNRRPRLVRAAGALVLGSAGAALALTQEDSPEVQEPTPSAEDLRETEFFETADYDGSGWISFREAEASLLLDRDEFGRFDADGDGRIDAEEFGARYRATIEQVGGFQPPIPDDVQQIAPPRGAEELRNAYDTDLNGSVDSVELGKLIEDYGIDDLSPQLAMNMLDTSGNGRLELVELDFVSTLLDGLRTNATGILPTADASTLEELFGVPVERPAKRGQLPRPPRITGPIRTFARLDLDRDGAITAEDLGELEFPLALPVRPATVIATLDLDGDGRLDPSEFAAAMGAAAPGPGLVPEAGEESTSDGTH